MQVLRRPIDPDHESGEGLAGSAGAGSSPGPNSGDNGDIDGHDAGAEDTEDAPGGALRLSAQRRRDAVPQDGGEAETLMRHAAHALYRVKRSGRDGVQFFDVEKRREPRGASPGRAAYAAGAGGR